jgi:hypothetical protein
MTNEELYNWVAFWGCITNSSIYVVGDLWWMALTWLVFGLLIYVFRKVRFVWPSRGGDEERNGH